MDLDGVDSIREVLSRDTIDLDKQEDETGIFDQVDAFVNLSRDNKSVMEVYLHPFNPDADASGTYRYAIWDKIAEGIANLQALRGITISDANFEDAEGETLVPDWEILTCILRRLRRGIRLCMRNDALPLWDTAALPAFAGAIHGQAMITGFSTGNGFPFHCLDILCSVLLTLPALENVSFEHFDDEGTEEGRSLESMVKLLQLPTLRDVTFGSVDFTNTLCQAVARALKERSEITDLNVYSCSFPEGGSAVIASALKTNTTLKCFDVDAEADEDVYEVLAAALLSNSTLQNLSFDASGSCSWLSPVFLALQVNSGLKKLSIYGIYRIDEGLSTAMRLGLGKNSTLESLELSYIKLGDDDISMWREAFSFLRTNTALKALYMKFLTTVMESRAATTIRMEVLAILGENESLETLIMPTSKDATVEDYLVFVAAIQSNTTLKSLRLHPLHVKDICVDEDESKDLISVLKKNYGLEEIPGLHHGAGDVNSIFELNRAGRRYLVQDGSSISKGVQVLSRVSNDINSVFFHLLENPRLCDRSAVEMSSSFGNIDNAAGSTSPGNLHSGGKREHQAPSHTGKEPRRRLE
jgi:hypothetical protein